MTDGPSDRVENLSFSRTPCPITDVFRMPTAVGAPCSAPPSFLLLASCYQGVAARTAARGTWIIIPTDAPTRMPKKSVVESYRWLAQSTDRSVGEKSDAAEQFVESRIGTKPVVERDNTNKEKPGIMAIVRPVQPLECAVGFSEGCMQNTKHLGGTGSRSLLDASSCKRDRALSTFPAHAWAAPR